MWENWPLVLNSPISFVPGVVLCRSMLCLFLSSSFCVSDKLSNIILAIVVVLLWRNIIPHNLLAWNFTVRFRFLKYSINDIHLPLQMPVPLSTCMWPLLLSSDMQWNPSSSSQPRPSSGVQGSPPWAGQHPEAKSGLWPSHSTWLPHVCWMTHDWYMI